jgi:hexosaminidase
MRQRVFVLLFVAAACGRSREPVAPMNLPPLIPLPASFEYRRGTWKPDGRISTKIESGGAPESYRLDVTPDGAAIVAADSAGLFYGKVTLDQLVEASTPVRALHIEDAPRFKYRGMHLDVARHFMPVEFVKRYIDLMSRYKLNTFHWHLTDDQGWRIEIRKYPRLTEVGGCRKETVFDRSAKVGDGTPHCGFYTQDQIRDVIQYAKARYVTIIPEIEMPGHVKAALAAYPELACTPGPFEVRTTWGVDEDVFCPKEETFRFIEDVLDEVTKLFPGPYVHVGGDEVPKTRWRASPVAEEVMRRENLADPAALQSWFIRRAEKMLIARNKRLIGWDEILEGGLAPQATVMSWRGSAGGVAAAREGHDVIMSPGSHLYFDAYQGDPAQEPLAFGGPLPLSRVYEFEPVPDSLAPDEMTHILGAQANVWTEYMKTPSHVEYMAWPRALALAEVLWSPKASRSWPSFNARLPQALRSLDRLKVNYRLPDVGGLDGDRLTLADAVTVSLSTAVPGGVVRYATGGADATETSAVFPGPIVLVLGDSGVRITARVFAPDGRKSASRTALFRRTTLAPAVAVDPARLATGLSYDYYELTARSVATLDTAHAIRSGTVSMLERRGDERPERYGIRFSGFLKVPTDAVYEFSLTSDDGSNLSIAGKLVVDNDGYHGADEKTGMIALAQGAHPFVMRYAQATGGAALSLRMRREGEAWHPVPPDWLSHTR